MKLAEVKKYFGNAEKCISTVGREFIMTEEIFDGIHKDGEDFYTSHGEFCLFEESKGFAKILTTKEPLFSITKEQLRQLTDPKVKEWFPEVFEVNLEVGKWYLEEGTSFLYYPTEIKDKNNVNAYGFTLTGRFSEDNGSFEWGTPKRFREATKEEVFEALKNEAVKRGFVKGTWIEWDGHQGQIKGELYWAPGSLCISAPCDIVTTKRPNENFPLMIGGTWATIIPTITKSEAEKLLNKKIID